MSALAKEKIFEGLRNYHTHKFPAIKNLEVNNLKSEFILMEDSIIGMILSLVSGKAEFVDSAKELNTFQEKLKTTIPVDSADEKSRSLFVSKISQLGEMMSLAKASNFQLKRVRAVKAR